VTKLARFVDIHCHLLPGVDDGPQNWDEALLMAQQAVSDGIGTIIATPHNLGAYRTNDGPTIRSRTAHMQQFLNQRNVDLSVLPGAEVRIEPDLVERVRTGEILTLADRGRYVLLELPHEVCLPIERLLDDLRRGGLTGVLAHAERNMGIISQPSLAESLVEAGCLLQVTAGSIMGTFGPQVEETAMRLIRQGAVHFVATDAHSSKSRRPLMRRTFDRLVENVGYKAAFTLCCKNPAAVLNDGHIEPALKKSNKSSLGRWLPWKKAG
jgi:protein-tyrosine phosphatase